MKKIVIIGSGGMAREILWLLQENNKINPEYEIMGFLSTDIMPDGVDGFPVYNDDALILESKEDIYAVIGIGSPAVRKKLSAKYKANPKVHFPSIVAKDVLMSDRVKIGEGSVICSGNVLTVDITIGNFVILNLGCTVGHDAVLKDFVQVNPQVSISGHVTIGEGTTVGTGARILQGFTVGENCTVGAGAVVVGNVKEGRTVIGNPAVVLRV